MALESLGNALERVKVLPEGVSLRLDPATNSAVWNAATTYFKGDIAISSVNGGAYIYTGGLVGGGDGVTSTRGGNDPSLDDVDIDATGKWQKFTQNGAQENVESSGTTVTIAGGVWTITNGNLLDTWPNSTWLVTVQGTAQWAVAPAAADYSLLTLVGNGTGGSTQYYTILPNTAHTATHFSTSQVVNVGDPVNAPPNNNTIILSGNSSGTAPDAVALKVNWTRLA